eukprot:TRINITY_DN975_c0_g1_i1.p1 TRINITY_DN975_c0_g1~~TRINITY_DN975_c0_g1_i1.p1  ORF type:complete len:440 (-),score=88.16 TRINITY_DN975_c0_g1_i1:71-1360(-)
MFSSRVFSRSKNLAKPSYLIFSRSLTNFWGNVEMGPPDPILGITERYNKDPNPKKINLGVGAYRDDEGKPYILNSVQEAERRIFKENLNHEYAGILGVPEFVKASQKLLFGENSENLLKRVSSAQALSGTGALRIGADFCKRFLYSNKDFYVPDPTWANHIPLFKDAGFNVKKYLYYDEEKISLDWLGIVNHLTVLPERSNILFHVCAHNPTGVDPNPKQWSEISKICLERNHLVLFDSAYQGFASGDPEKDAYPVRKFISDGHNPIICSSFAKNFGLYGERVGAIHVVCESEEKKEQIESQLKILIRPIYSNPPIFGARIVAKILNDPELSDQWKEEVSGMARRIIDMRKALVDNLRTIGSRRNWSHINRQIGMFCYSGLSPEQVDRLANEFSIYLVRTGRISMAGITSDNVEYLARAIHEVTSQKSE